MNILVFGANSEISHHFVAYCETKGHEMFLITRDANSYSTNSNKLIVEDYLAEKEQIKNFVKNLENPVVVFFNGALFENRPSKIPTQKEVEQTYYINFTVPFELYRFLEESISVNRFVFISSMAAVRLRNKNFEYGKSKQYLENNLLGKSKDNILIIRFGKIFTAMSRDHKTPPFSMSPNKAAIKIYNNLDKKNIVYGNLGLNLISKLIKIIPSFIFKKINI